MKNIQYTPQQQLIINKAVKHVLDGGRRHLVFQFASKAGCGKTTTLLGIVNKLAEYGIYEDEIAPMTYIGEAAINLRMHGLMNAKTIHSWLYEFVEQYITDEHGNIIFDDKYNKPKVKLVFRPKPLTGIKCIIIDEAYTVPIDMKTEIEARGIPIIACGDSNQLGPIEGEPGYLVNGEIYYLNQIMRQHKDSAILYIADQVLSGKQLSPGLYGKDVLVIEKKDLTDQMIAGADIMICGKNKTREFYNNYYRNKILNIHTKLPLYGEKLICRKNNWRMEMDGISLANGLIGTVYNKPTPSDVDTKLNTFSIDFRPDVLRHTYFPSLTCDMKYFTADINQRKLLKYDKFNIGEKFEFAYCITAHLSQGCQYPKGIYFQEPFGDISNNVNYVGVTRFSQFLIYVIPDIKKTFSIFDCK